MPEAVASCVIEAHIPWEQGLVYAPEVPEMALFPGSAINTCAIHWMITAEVAHALETGSAPDGSIGRRYVDILLERLQAVHSQDTGRIDQEAVKIARRIIGGGHLFVHSRNGGVRGEATGVAQGLMLVNAFESRAAAEGGDQDILLIAAVSADDPQDLEWAEEGRENGNYIVGIGPSHNDGLSRRCDVYFDDRCEEKDGVIAIPGRDEKVCPATGILNLVILHMLAAQFSDEMCRRGAVPYFYMGNYRVLGRDYNNVMKPFFQARGY